MKITHPAFDAKSLCSTGLSIQLIKMDMFYINIFFLTTPRNCWVRCSGSSSKRRNKPGSPGDSAAFPVFLDWFKGCVTGKARVFSHENHWTL